MVRSFENLKGAEPALRLQERRKRASGQRHLRTVQRKRPGMPAMNLSIGEVTCSRLACDHIDFLIFICQNICVRGVVLISPLPQVTATVCTQPAGECMCGVVLKSLPVTHLPQPRRHILRIGLLAPLGDHLREVVAVLPCDPEGGQWAQLAANSRASRHGCQPLHHRAAGSIAYSERVESAKC
jgi:hypothetical protein